MEGGFGGRVAQVVAQGPMKCLTFGLQKKFVDRYQPDALEEEYGLTVPQVVSSIEKSLN